MFDEVHMDAAAATVELLATLEAGAIAPLRASYAIELAKTGKMLPKREDLPERAFWSADELSDIFGKLYALFGAEEAERRFALFFVAISCHWFDAEHPDPDGFHLNIVAHFARAYVSDHSAGAGTPAAANAASGAGPSAVREPTLRSEVLDPLRMQPDCALLWDYAVVPSTTNGFVRGVWSTEARHALLLWLSHPRIAVWMQTDTPRDGMRGLPEYASRKYETSGWCCLERAIAELAKPESLRLDLAGRPPLPPLHSANAAAQQLPPFRYLRAMCRAPRRPPQRPEAFKALLTAGKSPLTPGAAAVFDAPTDALIAVEMYSAAFGAVSARSRVLDWHALHWSAADVEVLVAALPAFRACSSLDVSCGTLGSQAAAALRTALSALPALATLCGSGNHLGCKGAAELVDALRSAPALTSLALDASGLRDRGGVAVLRALQQRKGAPLRALSLRENELAVEASCALISLLEASPSLAVLDVACNRLTLDGTEQYTMLSLLPVALRKSSPLTTLSLGANGLGPECAPVLASLLASNTTLTALDVRSNEFYTTAAATHLAAAVLASRSLQCFGGVPVRALAQHSLDVVDLAEEGLGASEAFVLGELLLGSSAVQACNVDGSELLPMAELRGTTADGKSVVESVDLSHAGLGYASAIVLSSLLSANSVILYLNLSHNRLGPRAAAALADGLYFQTSLTHLDLSANPLGEAGARALAEAVAVAPTPLDALLIDGGALPVNELRGTKGTRTVDLDNLGLGPLSALLIEALVRGNLACTSLSLADNALGDEGAAAVAGALKTTRVTALNLWNNGLGAEGARAIGTLLVVGHSPVTELNIDGFALPVKKLRGIVGDEDKPIDSLALQKRKLGPLAGIVIGELVRTNVTLTNLNLSGNALGAAGGLALALATAANPSLATVDIRNNKLDAETKAACRAMPAVASRLLYASVGEEQASAAEEMSAAKPGKTQRTKTKGVGEKAGASSRPASSPTSVKKVGTVPLGGDHATAMPGKFKVDRC